MFSRPLEFTLTDTLFPYTTLFRSRYRKAGRGDPGRRQRLEQGRGLLGEEPGRVERDHGQGGRRLAQGPEGLRRGPLRREVLQQGREDRKSTRLNSSH